MNVNIWILILIIKGNTPATVEFFGEQACKNAQVEMAGNWEQAKRIAGSVCVPKYIPAPPVVR